MSLTHLKSFLEVYRQGSITRAAKILGITQPAVTQHIAALESMIGRQLFERMPRGVTPTNIAHDMVRRIERPLDMAEETLALMRMRSARLAGTIHLCGPSDILSDLIIPKLHVLTEQNISVQMHPAIGPQIWDMLASGNADFGFSIFRSDDVRFASSIMGTEETLLVAAPEMAYRIRSQPQLAKALEDMPFVSYSIERDLIRRWMTHNQIDIGHAEERVTAPDLRALRNLVRNGLGWSVLPRFLIKEELSLGSLEIIEGGNSPLMIDYFLIWTKASMRNPRNVKVKSLLQKTFSPDIPG